MAGRITLTREQSHILVRNWCAPHLRAERHKDVDAVFDYEEAKAVYDYEAWQVTGRGTIAAVPEYLVVEV